MRDEDRIDLSPLDPFVERARLDRAVDAILDRAASPAEVSLAAARARRALSNEIAAQGRRALLAACAAAAAAWILVSASPRPRATVASRDPIDVLSAWAENGGVPHGEDVLRALEAPDVD